MSPALRDLEQVLLEGNLAHGGHPVLSMCVSHTVITLDDAGNRKPSKRKSTAKIDGLVALAMRSAWRRCRPNRSTSRPSSVDVRVRLGAIRSSIRNTGQHGALSAHDIDII